MSDQITAECLDCGHRYAYDVRNNRCSRCGSQWAEARYDYDGLALGFPQKLSARPFNLWRYRELLPVGRYNPQHSMGEGGTPLIHASNLGTMLGLANIYIKDERQGPTNSFKDRQAAVGIAALKEAGITEAVIASTGNVAIAYSAYAARTGIKLWAFLTSLVPAEKMREVAIYGTQVVKVTASYDQAKKVAAEFARQRGLILERGARTIPSVEAMKTIAYEIVEQVTAIQDIDQRPATRQQPPWKTPDWYFQAVSGGLGPLGVLKGFQEMKKMGLIDRLPAIASIQTKGCSPMVQAWERGEDIATAVASPRTNIATLATGDPGRTYTLLANRVKQSGGFFESVTDAETFRTVHILAKLEGLSVEPAAAVAFAGLIKAARSGKINPEETIVVNCTGHTMPVEKTVLGKGWSRNVVLPTQALTNAPREGLLAALSRVTSDRYHYIEIVDDTPDARRLIRRILQSQGKYSLYEAENGQQAIQIARQEPIDLIILDLMMPEIDGFEVLQALEKDEKTAAIPVIIVTAKELTPRDKTRLNGQVQATMQKGEFMDDDLGKEVQHLLHPVTKEK